MSVQIKICGLTSREAVDATLKAGAEFGGLVFFAASPRHLGFERARGLATLLRGRTRIVTLMVDPPDALVMDVMGAIAPDLIQLHGKETPARVAEIAGLTKRPVIKALAIADAADVARAHAYADVADYFLFDAKADAAATRPGGLGAAFDWQLLAGLSFRRPWGLAGGLTAENVVRAIRLASPNFVDASSGVEDAPGRKSPEKIAAFVSSARNALYTDQKVEAGMRGAL
jgi:phosphoribosylanthranilate isomerase